MRVVTHRAIVNYYSKNKRSRAALELWYEKISKKEINNLAELKFLFPTADYVGNDRIVFDIKRNDYRLICIVKFSSQKVYVRFIDPHSEYDKIDVKHC